MVATSSMWLRSSGLLHELLLENACVVPLACTDRPFGLAVAALPTLGALGSVALNDSHNCQWSCQPQLQCTCIVWHSGGLVGFLHALAIMTNTCVVLGMTHVAEEHVHPPAPVPLCIACTPAACKCGRVPSFSAVVMSACCTGLLEFLPGAAAVAVGIAAGAAVRLLQQATLEQKVRL